MSEQQYGIVLPNGCQFVHQAAANRKTPFPEMIPDLTMFEFAPGTSANPAGSGEEPQKLPIKEDQQPLGTIFSGQLGIIPFKASLRLPRHVHISKITTNSASSPKEEAGLKFVTERILVLNGVAMVELNGEVYVVAPNTLVVIAPGVPHTWTACPAGLRLRLSEQSGNVVESTGEFLMVYEYEEPTGFFPTSQTRTLGSVGEYEEFRGDLQDIRFPSLDPEGVVKKAKVVIGKQLLSVSEISI